MEKIVRKSNIWDLHVHTPYKYNQSSNSFSNDNSDDFVEKITNILNNPDNNKLGMISFTDHNYFNLEVYTKFKEKIESLNLKITIIPGIELDLYMLHNNSVKKHILFYFPEDTDLERLNEILNNYISTKINASEKIYFDDFINYLFDENFKFAISPHAFKQGTRGIESEWMDEERNRQRISLFSSSFFVFWEASKSGIVKAREYIEEFYDDSSLSITNFSDSKNYENFEQYLQNPFQYFYSLNCFKGMMLVSSEKSRVTEFVQQIDEEKKNQKIKTIIFNNDIENSIELSDRLNVIIGGRGKGKSILLDKIGLFFKCNSHIRTIPLRKNFLDSFNINIKNFSNAEMSDDLELRYLNQAYINELFNDESSKKIESYFSSEFNQVRIESSEIVKQKLKQLMNLDDESEPQQVNINNIVSKLQKNIKPKISLIENDIKANVLSLAFEDPLGINEPENYYESMLSILPEEIINEDIKEMIQDVVFESLKGIIKYNYIGLKKTITDQIVSKNLKEYNEKINEELKDKNSLLSSIEQKLRSIYSKNIKKIRIINSLYSINTDLTTLRISGIKKDGFKNNKFYFVKYLSIEHPVEYIVRIIKDAVNGNIIRNKDNKTNKEIFQLFVFGLDGNFTFLNTNHTMSSIMERVSSLEDIKIIEKNKIIHFNATAEKYNDLNSSSPGMQTNSIMEYVLNQESDIPLLIDQPEDNVDNESRYMNLTRWIKENKINRQILLVSHDANIVINGDAENLIIADYDGKKFKYTYGALEYSNNLDIAALLLDGGIIAVKRRIQKYGE